MERLTEHWGDGNVRVKEHAYISAAQRLADYEDTGLTPEQCENDKTIIELAPTDDLYDVIWGSECHFCYSCGAKMDGDSYGELK